MARPRQVVSPGATPSAADYDLVVVGGNLGILLATALAVRGLRVAVVEAGALRGRNQDWNASRKEVLELGPTRTAAPALTLTLALPLH